MSAESPDSPFVETPGGERFFVNAVLSAPALLVLWPVLLGGMLRGAGALSGPSPLLDPVPAFADSVGPYVAWLSVVPLWTCARNLRLPLPRAARWTLILLVAVHAGVLVWWIGRVAAG